MDPIAALEGARMAADTLAQLLDVDEYDGSAEGDEAVQNAAGNLLTNFRSLDDWLSQGGFLPTAWRTSEDVIPSDLRLSFTPDAIREHFEGDDPDPTEGLTDEQLTGVGRMALDDAVLYDAFHSALTLALDNRED